MKTCIECGLLKPIDDFYKNKSMADGHLNKCKICFSVYKKGYWIENKAKLQQYKKKHRQEKAEHYKEYAKEYRDKNIESIKAKEKERRSKNTAKIREYERDYAKTERGKEVKRMIQNRYLSTEKGKETVRKSRLKYVENNPIKNNCHKIVRNAVKAGTLASPDSCERCGTEEKLHAHHDDYSLPLSVRWLCQKCHFAWHKKNGEGLNATFKSTTIQG